MKTYYWTKALFVYESDYDIENTIKDLIKSGNKIITVIPIQYDLLEHISELSHALIIYHDQSENS